VRRFGRAVAHVLRRDMGDAIATLQCRDVTTSRRHDEFRRNCRIKRQKAITNIDIRPITPLFRRVDFDASRRIDPLFAFFDRSNDRPPVCPRCFTVSMATTTAILARHF